MKDLGSSISPRLQDRRGEREAIGSKEGRMRFESEDREHIRAAVNLVWWPICYTGSGTSPSSG